MINRWQGNTGRVQRLPEKEERRAPPTPKPEAPRHREPPQGQAAPPRRFAAGLPPLFSAPGKKPGRLLSGLEGLSKLLPGGREPLETEDIILLLMLYLMYRESGDSELLMIMGAMFLL